MRARLRLSYLAAGRVVHQHGGLVHVRVQRRIHEQDGRAVRGVLPWQLQGGERVVGVLGVRGGDVLEHERGNGVCGVCSGDVFERDRGYGVRGRGRVPGREAA